MVQLVDVCEVATIIVMPPEHRVAVIASTYQTVFCQPQAGQVGQVSVLLHCQSKRGIKVIVSPLILKTQPYIHKLVFTFTVYRRNNYFLQCMNGVQLN